MLFLVLLTNVNAQDFSGGFSYPVEKVEWVKKDKPIINVFYKINFVADSSNSNRVRKDIGILQLGKQYSKFINYNGLKKDSIMYQFSKTKDNLGAAELGILLGYKSQWKNSLAKDDKNKMNVFQDVIVGEYQYEEQQPILNWVLSDETKSIFDYTCRRATVHYRGRDYVAWYTTEIPFSNGPYVFGGLPGLILEIYDTKNHYHFAAMALNKDVSNDIYIKKSSKILILKREEFRKIQKNYHENPGFFHGNAYNTDGSVMNARSASIPYNPIELE